MPYGNLDSNKKRPITTHAYGPLRPSGTLPPESVNAGYHGTYDSRGKYTRLTAGLVGIYSMTGRCFGLPGRSPARGGDHFRRVPRAPQRGGAVNSGFGAKFTVRHCEREPGLRGQCRQDVPPRVLVIAGPFGAAGHRRGQQIRTHHACTRLPRLRKKYNTHEQIPSPLVGHSCGASPSPHITPISGPFPGDIYTWAYVPGPLPGDKGRGPGTCAHSPGRTPPNSHEKSAPTRCVVGWVDSGYVERGAHTTRHLSSCLVTSPGFWRQMRGGSGGR